MVESAISIQNVKKTFNGKDFVLNGVNLEIPKGAITVLIGFSGTGKSVLLRHILGLLKPTEGVLNVLNTDLYGMEPEQLAAFRSRFGVLFQNAALFDDMTTLENVCFPLKEHRRQMPVFERERIAKETLSQVGLDQRHYLKLPNELSGGMRKRVGLARALVLDPEIILYDEPTTGLDPILTEMVDNLILDTHRSRQGSTSVVVSHDLFAAFRIADYVAMLDQGKILLHGTPDDFLNTDIDLVKRFVSKGIHRGKAEA